MADYSVNSILEMVRSRGRISLAEIYEAIEDQGLSAHDLEKNASGNQRWRHNIRGNLQLLKKRGQVENPQKGIWAIAKTDPQTGAGPVEAGLPSQPDAIRGTGIVEAEEGLAYKTLLKHRRREQRLRKAKLADHLAKGKIIRCEVPGCGFDFHRIYGEIGRDYAHVHHLLPLAGRKGGETTRLGDLAIVCANCHAMIHRGRQCRSIDKLIRNRDQATS